MSTPKKADHRLVQPRPEHYKERTRPDGVTELVLCGPYSLEQRDAFFNVQISLHNTRNPTAEPASARTAAFQKWRNIVFATIGDEYVPVTGKASKDSVKLLK